MMSTHTSIVYGPIASRRLGVSLGLNIVPPGTKTCNYNCPYCQYGWSRPLRASTPGWPSAERVARALDARLGQATARGERFDRITVAGDGEPTLHPQFAAVVGAIAAVRDRSAAGTPLAILSNASTLHQRRIVDALAQIDERYLKLDAGDPALLRRINGPSADLHAIIDGCRRLERFTLQSMFVTDGVGRVDNATDAAVQWWLQALQQVRPQAVHVYTLDRPGAWPYLRPVPADRLETIGARARHLGFDAQVFPGRRRD
jgi:wyosine [tRNA(Phe)-imidazoG37] synthetase (radical SAM superfamily)